jgi:outer membrane protein TolC
MKNILNLLLSSFFLCFSLIDSASAQDLLPRPDKPLTLEQCVALGLKFNPALRGNQASVEAQKARVEQALAAYYPQINFNAGYNANTFNFITLAGQFRPYTYNYKVSEAKIEKAMGINR